VKESLVMVPRVQLRTHARKLKALDVCQHHVSALMLITSKKIIFFVILVVMIAVYQVKPL